MEGAGEGDFCVVVVDPLSNPAPHIDLSPVGRARKENIHFDLFF